MKQASSSILFLISRKQKALGLEFSDSLGHHDWRRRMKRREFITGALAIAAATRASAEERVKAFRVAIVHPVVPAAGIEDIA